MKGKTKKIILSICCVIGLIGIAGYYSVNMTIDNMLNEMEKTEEFTEEDVHVVKPVEPEEPKEEEVKRNIKNIVLLGIDKDEYGYGSRSDAMKIISLDYDNKKLKFTSLQRDNLVWLPMMERYEKLNHAYWRNDVKGALSAMNYNFDMDLTQYVSFHYDSFGTIVDILGGVPLYLSAGEANYLKLNGGEGTYVLNGEQALRFCRIRYLDSDYSRMERHNRVIKAIIDQYKNKDILELLSVTKEVLPYIETNLTNKEIKDMLMSVLSFDLNNIEKYQFPANGYESQLCTVSLYGYSPMYILKDFSGEVEQMHKNIYGEDGYTASERVLKAEKEMLEIAGY